MEAVHQTAQKAATDLHSRPWFPTSAFASGTGSGTTISNAEWASGAAAFSSPLARSSVVYKAERPLQSPEPALRAGPLKGANEDAAAQRSSSPSGQGGGGRHMGGGAGSTRPRRSSTPPPRGDSVFGAQEVRSAEGGGSSHAGRPAGGISSSTYTMAGARHSARQRGGRGAGR